jgi:hypothetical protein
MKVPSSLVLALPLVMASGAFAVTHPLEGLNPAEYGFSQNTVDGWFRGWEFTVNADDLWVTELGLRMPVAGDRVYLELWDSTTQSLIATTDEVTTAANEWQYFALDSNVPLDNGGTYTVGILCEGVGHYWFSSGLPSEWYPSGDIEYQTMRYHNNSFSSWPSSSLPGYQYGVPDIGYIPAPATTALLALGLVGARRRRKV